MFLTLLLLVIYFSNCFLEKVKNMFVAFLIVIEEPQ